MGESAVDPDDDDEVHSLAVALELTAGITNDGDAATRALLPARDRIRGVFFGHVHRGTQVYQDGILYTSVASTFCQFHHWPNDQKYTLDDTSRAAFNFVTLTPAKTIVKEYTPSCV